MFGHRKKNNENLKETFDAQKMYRDKVEDLVSKYETYDKDKGKKSTGPSVNTKRVKKTEANQPISNKKSDAPSLHCDWK